MSEWLDSLTTDAGVSLDGSGLWIQVFVIIFLTLLASYFANRALTHLHKKLEKTRTMWDDALVHAARRPLRMLVWLVGITYAISLIHEQSDLEIFAAAEPIRSVGVIALIGWFLLRFIREGEKTIISGKEARGEEVDRTTIDAVSKLLRISVTITVALIALQTLGFSVSGILAFGGVSGVAVGFAARDLLANFFGAMMLYLDRPFAVGDWIRSPDREIEGTVENIGWRQTCIRTFDKRPLYVPNSAFSTIGVQNPSRMTHRRINETIGVRYDDMSKVNTITKDVEDMLKNHPEIDNTQTLMVHLNAFGDSSVDFFIYTFTKTTDWQKYHEVKQDVLLKIAEIIAKHGADMAFPTRTVHVDAGISPELQGLGLEK